MSIAIAPEHYNVGLHPLIAIGCADGIVRILPFITMKIICKLTNKTSSISKLSTLYLSKTTIRFVSGSCDGTLSIWEPFHKQKQNFVTPDSLNTTVPASVSIKAHDGDILDMKLAHGMDTDNQTKAYFITLGLIALF